MKEVNAIKSALDKDKDIDFSCYDPHAVVGAFCAFFQELPEPLFPSVFFEKILHTEQSIVII